MNTVLSVATAALAVGLVGSGGCLDPLVSDEVPASYLGKGEAAPSLGDDSLLLSQVDNHDGVGRTIPYTQGFAAGKPVALWSFGTVSPKALPMYVLVDQDGVPLADHPPIIDAVPGDAGYQPFCAIFHVMVLAPYDGERLVSLDALRDARNGPPALVEDPETSGAARACPVVHPDVVLEQPSGESEGPSTAYYKGVEVPIFLFDERPLPEGTLDMPAMPRFHLRREGGEPLSESLRRVDMTGDGDTRDSNDVLMYGPGEDGFTEAMTIVNVVVGAAYASIDTSQDDTVADFTAGGDLFGMAGGQLDPVVGNVVAWEPLGETRLVVARELAP